MGRPSSEGDDDDAIHSVRGVSVYEASYNYLCVFPGVSAESSIKYGADRKRRNSSTQEAKWLRIKKKYV